MNASLADVLDEAVAELNLPTLAARANEAHQRAEGAAHSALEFARQAGEYLAQAKSMCKHGEWLPWLEDNFEGTRRTATRYMQVAEGWEEITNGTRVSQMSLRQALELLAEKTDEEPAEEPDEVQEVPPEIQPPPEMFGIPVWFEDRQGEAPAIPQEPFPIREETVADEPVVMAHVGRNSGNNEWYTPQEYIGAALRTLGWIDLDPASSAIANKTVQADTFYTVEDDGLTKEWEGRVWMNPPYAAGLIEKFIEKLCLHYDNDEVYEAIVLVNNATETAWFQHIAERATSICFPKRRVRFLDPDGNPGAPLQGQAVIYLGAGPEAFKENFENFGFVL